jgi:multiple sugar transport system substrate-binding protein
MSKRNRIVGTVLGGIALISSALIAGAQGTKEITFWTQFTGPVDLASLKEITANFTKQTGINVKFVQVNGPQVTDNTKLMTAVAGGTGPDVYMLDRFIVAERAASGLLEPLDSYIKADKPNLAADYQPFAWAETQFKGGTYALPFDTDTRALYYRKDIIREAGLNPDVLDPAKGVPKLETVMALAAKLNKTDASGAYTRIGFLPWPNQGWHYTWGFAYKGKFYDEKTCKVTPLDKGVVAGYQFLYDTAKTLDPKKAAAFKSTYWVDGQPPAQDPFITGRQPMVVTGDWQIAVMKEYAPKADYGITYIPTPDGSKTTWAGGWSMVMPKGAKNPAEAYKLIRYMTGAEGQRVYVKETAHLPTIKALVNDNTLYDQRHLFFKDLLANASSRPALPVGALYWDQLTSAMDKVTLNQATPQQALKDVETRVNEQLSRFCSK